MLTLKQSDYDKIVAHAKANLPEEACGLIAGTKDGDVKEIKKACSGQGYARKRTRSAWQLAFAPGVTVPSFGGG